MPPTSAAGRFQFAEESANSVSVWIPRRGAASMMRRAVSAPARCPAERGSPRDVAQRPLPSEIMATCKPEFAGGANSAPSAAAGAGGREEGMGTTTCEVPSAGPAALAGDGNGCSAGVADSIGYPISAANQRFYKLSCKLLCNAKYVGKKILPVATPRAWRGSALPCD